MNKGTFGTQEWKYHLFPYTVVQYIYQHSDARLVFPKYCPGAAFGATSPGDLLEAALLSRVHWQGALVSFPVC